MGAGFAGGAVKSLAAVHRENQNLLAIAVFSRKPKFRIVRP